MSLRLPDLPTARLVIRDFRETDLDAVHRLLDVEIDLEEARTLEARRRWLTWTMLAYEQLALLFQPPYGDRAVTLKDSGALIGVVGYSPLFHPLAAMLRGENAADARWLPEMGLYWALSPAHRGRGFATEAANALIDYAFANFNLARIVANTDFDNVASQAVMRRLGMTLYHNDAGAPEWFEVLGVLEPQERPQSGR